MEFRLLGQIEISNGNQPPALGGPKQRLVLVHLLLRVNRLVTTDRLIDDVWGEEPPAAARSTLQVYVSHIRKALGPGRLESRSGGYVLRADPMSVDAVRFERLVNDGQALVDNDPAAAVRILRDALGLWRGPVLDDLAHHASLRGEISRLEELRMSATEERIGAELELGRHRELVAELDTLVELHPLRERLWEHLMRALYRSGRQADALAAYQRARRLLADELGIDPSPKLQLLEEQILRQDPALEVHGDPLRGYRLLEQVGAGSFGSVNRAYQPQVGREVAVKIIHPQFANNPGFIRRFEAEAQLVARLEHPHIVPLYDFWREPDGAYLVMRYLRGGSLREALGKAPLTPERVVRLVDEVAGALEVAHRQGVVHRDVKPANILFDEEGNSYLSDFGVARDLALAELGGLGGGPSPLTHYLSPEEIQGKPATPRADIYSLGLVLYEALAGRHPFSESPSGNIVDKHLREPVPSIAVARPDVPEAVDEVIGKATAKDPRERYPDATALVAEFRAALPPRRARPVAIARTGMRNPYKGLRPFLEADTDDFFGREALVERIVGRLREEDEGSRFLAVVGPSGSGKSSLVRAGVVPALRRGALPGSEKWFMIEMHPGAEPFKELEVALLRVAVRPPADLGEQLEWGDSSRLVGELLPADSELLLVVDQFEELFTLVADDPRRVRFLEQLVAAARSPASRMRIVVTLRADFYDRPLSYRGFGDLLAARTEAVTPLSVEELRCAISGPAERLGITVDPSLVADVIADVVTQPGALPLLQYALTELYELRRDSSLTADAYHEIGGVSGALARRAEDICGRLNETGKEATRQLFLRLITLGHDESEDTRRRVLRVELTSLQVDRDAIDNVIDIFGARRLLSFDRDPVTRGPTVEVAHEALLGWPRLRTWVNEGREGLRAHRRLTEAAHEWQRMNRDEDLLYRGARLAEAVEWRRSHSDSLNALEQDFLGASIRMQESEQRRAEAQRRKEIDDARRIAASEGTAKRRKFWIAVILLMGLGGMGIAATIANQQIDALLQQKQRGAELSDDDVPGLVAIDEIVLGYTAQSAAVRGALVSSNQEPHFAAYRAEVEQTDFWEEQASGFFELEGEQEMFDQLVEAGHDYQDLVENEVIPLATFGKRSQAFSALSGLGELLIAQVEVQGELLQRSQQQELMSSMNRLELSDRSALRIKLRSAVAMIAGAIILGAVPILLQRMRLRRIARMGKGI
jgi:DNA-binding SARP family transcriptional activator